MFGQGRFHRCPGPVRIRAGPGGSGIPNGMVGVLVPVLDRVSWNVNYRPCRVLYKMNTIRRSEEAFFTALPTSRPWWSFVRTRLSFKNRGIDTETMDHENLDHGGQVTSDGLDYVYEGRLQTRVTVDLGWSGVDFKRALRNSASSEQQDWRRDRGRGAMFSNLEPLHQGGVGEISAVVSA